MLTDDMLFDERNQKLKAIAEKAIQQLKEFAA